MAAYYDSIDEQYKQSKELPFRLHIEAYTYFDLLGDLAEKSLLDLACGEGFYTRKFRQRGAARVLGVDISAKMIELARQQEAKAPLGIEYIVCDVLDLGEIGNFDLVVASFLLNYAQTQEQLLRMCQSVYINLKQGGRFVSINNNSEQPPESYLSTEKYGFIKSISEPLQEGAPITYTVSVDGQKFSFDNYYLSRATYEWAFRTVGFKQIRWQSPIVSTVGVREFGNEFWRDFLDNQPIIGIECWK
ncbi:MAG: class I SAM-dependent methyltransferase [Pseudanabaenales cyanobacterium]|nr:class I SAM-dependent methyltransferase [Pseudanabaenales cyanobacterium]